MGWSHRRNQELAQRGRERQAALKASDCRPGREQHQEYYSELAGRRQVHYDYRTPDGTLFTCIDNTLADCQARRNAWLVERAESAQRERARAEAEDAASLVDADLYRNSDGGYDR